MTKFNIALVSDYFYPSTGGVETHIKSIGEELVALGHSVIVITHKYPGYEGLVKVGNLIVYYLDIPIVACNTTFPLIFGSFSIYQSIFKRHSIEIVHGHQSMSSMCIESLFHANFLNIKTVLTDHSMFEIDKFERILVDNIMAFVCKYVDWVICVSEIGKENTQLRTEFPPKRMSVIPNGYDSRYFYPKNKNSSVNSKINILVCSRLVYRKGIDLLIKAIPLICQNENIRINIVGDGPKKDEIEQVIDKNDLKGRVNLLGARSYEEIGEIFRQNDILLNTSLTETFCMVIVEAAVCGLTVVTTKVGGIAELKGIESIFFCGATPKSIAKTVFEAIELKSTNFKKNLVCANTANFSDENLKNQNLTPTNSKNFTPLNSKNFTPTNSKNLTGFKNFNEILSKEYSWPLIAFKTEQIYMKIPEKEITASKVESDYPGFKNTIYRVCVRIEMWLIWISEKFVKNK